MILVLHGWGQSGEYWRDIRSKFSPGELEVLDLPGFGTEPIISDNWKIPDYANWVNRAIEKKGWQDIDLMGHSFGGRVASCLASQNPGWLRSLILYGAPCLYRPSLEIRLKIGLAKITKRIVPIKLLKKVSRNPDLVEAERRGVGKVFRNAVGFDQTDLLPRIKVPTLLVWGEKDSEVFLRIAKEIHNLIPGSRLEILSGLGHNAHLENPNLFYGKIRSFLEHA